MMRTGRILLVESEDDLRQTLAARLSEAGHDVASVPDGSRAAELLREGLAPDIVVTEMADETEALRLLVPEAIHLRIDRAAVPGPAFAPIDEAGSCPADPAAVLRRVEEVLLDHQPLGSPDDTSRCLDLARRLANALPHVADTDARIDLVTEGFDTFFGVKGTLVVRQGPGADDWIEASQGLEENVSRAVSAEIARRTSHRNIRPFLTRLSVNDRPHEIACLSVRIGGNETVLALELARAPEEPGLREALMNLVGSAVRAAGTTEQLESSRSRLEALGASFDHLIELSHEFTRVGRREELGMRVLEVLRRELSMSRSALFLRRRDGEGLFELLSASGFSGIRLDGLGLSSFHGVGRACLESGGTHRLADLRGDAASQREQKLLAGAGLRWVAALKAGRRELGLLFFGGREDQTRLETWETQALDAVVGSSAVALCNLEKQEGLRRLALGGFNGLVAAVELRFPEDRGHSERVARGAVRIGREVGMSADELRLLALSALLHDVGKVGVLPGGTPDEEERLLRMHPILGSQILSRAQLPADAIHGVEQHHERYDGHGYPYGYRGEGIHAFGRVLAIVDAFDRMTQGSDTMSVHEALCRLELGAGLLFDPGLVAVFSSDVGRGPSGDTPLADESWLEDLLAAS